MSTESNKDLRSKVCLFSFCCSKSYNPLRFIMYLVISSAFLENWSFQTPARKIHVRNDYAITPKSLKSVHQHEKSTQETVENLMFILQNSSKVCSNLPHKWFEIASYLLLSFCFINISRMKGNSFQKIIIF